MRFNLFTIKVFLINYASIDFFLYYYILIEGRMCVFVLQQASHNQHFSGNSAKTSALQDMMKLVSIPFQ